MKYAIAYVLLVIVSLNIISGMNKSASDSYIRDRVVLLTGQGGACSGIQVKAPSKKVYILTAAHCRILADEQGTITAQTENNKKYTVRLISLDIKHDLMLLSNADGKSIEVADSIKLHEKIHTMTHGGKFPTFRTDGELLEERTLKVMGGYIESPEDYINCPSTDYSSPAMTEVGFVCMMTMTMQISTAYIIPGSSGGAVVDEDGKLIGIVSCTFDLFSGIVPLHNIIDFLKDK